MACLLKLASSLKCSYFNISRNWHFCTCILVELSVVVLSFVFSVFTWQSTSCRKMFPETGGKMTWCVCSELFAYVWVSFVKGTQPWLTVACKSRLCAHYCDSLQAFASFNEMLGSWTLSLNTNAQCCLWPLLWEVAILWLKKKEQFVMKALILTMHNIFLILSLVNAKAE